MWASIKYGMQEFKRRRIIQRQKAGGLDWNQIAQILNEQGFRNRKGEEITGEDVRIEFQKLTAEEEERERKLRKRRAEEAEFVKKRREKKRARKEAKQARRLETKHWVETEERRKLIAKLYKDQVSLEEIAFILDRAGYRSPTGEEITTEEIKIEHADWQIEEHKKTI